MKFAVIIFFILFCLCFQRKRIRNAGMYEGIMFGGLLYFGIIPLIIECFPDKIGYNRYFYVLSEDIYDYFFTYIYIFVFFCVFLISYKFRLGIVKHKYATEPYMDEEKIKKWLLRIGMLCFFAGGLSLVLFFYSLGGLTKALSLGETVRGFQTDLADYTSYRASLLVIPARLVTVAPFCIWGYLCMMEKSLRSLSVKLMLWLSCALSVMYYLFNAGRAPLIAFLLCLFVPLFNKRGERHVWKFLIVLGCICLPLLDYMDSLFVYLQSGVFEEFETDYFSYVSQFRAPINNVFYAFDIVNKYGCRFGSDFVTVFLDFLPGLFFEPSYVPTSEFLGGANWKSGGGVPNDIITFSILEFRFLGLIIVPYVLGVIAKKVDKIIESTENLQLANVLSTVLAVNSFLLVSSADFVSIVRGFSLILIPGIVLISSKKKTVRLNSYASGLEKEYLSGNENSENNENNENYGTADMCTDETDFSAVEDVSGNDEVPDEQENEFD